jgi:very-short-patch-repair endonuclease
MDKKTFKSLLKYYLSCMDAEEAMSLQLRKNQENKSYIFLKTEEVLFSKDSPQLEVSITDSKQRKFIERKAPDAETLIDLQYGFPVFKDKKDMLSPLFFIEVETAFSDQNTLRLLPQIKTLSVNRMHFVQGYGAEETQRICEELEGEFGSFEARMKAAEEYIPSLFQEGSNEWISQPILFRSNFGGSKSGQRYDLTYLLKDEEAHTKETALKYLLDASHESAQSKIYLPILEIGALNDQQEKAVEKGLKEPLSVVTGPPGTGKTQVVTALLASAVNNNEKVLFASNNNMPVDGVYERLGQSTGSVGNWLVRLGNQKKRKECHQTITSLLERVETSDLSELSLEEDQETFANLEEDIAKTRASLKTAQAVQVEISKLHEKEKRIEQRLPEGWVQQFAEIDPIALDLPALKKLKSHSYPGFWLWLRRKLFGLEKFINVHNDHLTTLCGDSEYFAEYESWLLLDENWDESLKTAQKIVKYLRLHQNWVLCIRKRQRLEQKLTSYATTSDLFDLKTQKSKTSQKLFEKWWLKNICNSVQEATEAFKGYYKDIDDYSAGRHRRLEKSLSALKHFFPIWITTNQSVSAIMPPEEALFDLVVIDEAGQCDIPSIIPLLYRAKRAVIIGDPHQFKHITSIKDDIEHAIAQELDIEDTVSEWSFKRRSAFDRSAASTQSSTLLKQHYRCHPDIIEFSNLNFYDGKLVKQIALSQFQNNLPIEENGLIWHNTIGQARKAPKGAWNPAEIEKTVEILERWSKQGLFSDTSVTYGVVTPFRKQVEEMRKALSKCSWYNSAESRFTIGTAHSFQGSECDVLIYSPVVADGMADYLIKFAAEQKDLINVTVTRAKSLLYIVGDLHACQAAYSDTPLHQLASYAERIRKQQRHPLNAAEKSMVAILEELNLSYTPQYEFGQYRLDFLLNAPSGERYDIEVDGDIHLTAEAIKHDERRDAYVESRGLNILRFAARDVMHKPDLIKERLMRI